MRLIESSQSPTRFTLHYSEVPKYSSMDPSESHYIGIKPRRPCGSRVRTTLPLYSRLKSLKILLNSSVIDGKNLFNKVLCLSHTVWVD